jgi:hypothetical protein
MRTALELVPFVPTPISVWRSGLRDGWGELSRIQKEICSKKNGISPLTASHSRVAAPASQKSSRKSRKTIVALE